MRYKAVIALIVVAAIVGLGIALGLALGSGAAGRNGPSAPPLGGALRTWRIRAADRTRAQLRTGSSG